LQAEFEQGLARHLERFAFLDHGAYCPGSGANCGTFAGIARDAADCRSQTRTTDQTLGASLGAAAAFHLVIAGEKRIRRPADDDVCQFQLQLGEAGCASGLFCFGQAAVNRISLGNDDRVGNHRINFQGAVKREPGGFLQESTVSNIRT
jgi:hypothetical protein